MRDRVLILETTMGDGSVAVAVDGALASEVRFTAREASTGARAEALAPSVDRALAEVGITPRGLTGIVVSAGPGGFTSLRCAAALAKGMCAALDIPLYAVPSLAVIAWSAELEPRTVHSLVLDAGRGESFVAAGFADDDGRITLTPVELLNAHELAEVLARAGHRDVGPGRTIDVVPRAGAVVPHLATVLAAGPVSLDSWEPDYGRLAEAQVKWEAAHGRPLVT
jgi:tRNA threonylcarbamoyladenosine biosynthesis protein TsaB